MEATDEHEPCGIRQPKPRKLRVSPAFAERQPLEQGDNSGHHHTPTVVQHTVGVARLSGHCRCRRTLPVLQRPRKAETAPADAHKQGVDRIPPELLHQHYARVPHASGHNTGCCGQADGRQRRPFTSCPTDSGTRYAPSVAACQPADGVPQGDNRQHEDKSGARRHSQLRARHIPRSVEHSEDKEHKHHVHTV